MVLKGERIRETRILRWYEIEPLRAHRGSAEVDADEPDPAKNVHGTEGNVKPPGLSAGMMSQYMSTYSMVRSQKAQKASVLRFRFTCLERSPKNGMAKWQTRSVHDTMPQPPAKRSLNQCVSSGMSPYQISMNWENAMYDQKITNANMILPRS